VLGSAGIAALMEARITAEFPQQSGGSGAGAEQTGSLPGFLLEPFSRAMGQSLVLPAVVLIAAIVAALFLAKPKQTVAWKQTGSVATQPDGSADVAPADGEREHVGAHASAAAPATAADELAAGQHPGKHVEA